MADTDHKSSLPVRSEKDGLDERLHTKIVDFEAPDAAENQVQVSEKLLHVRTFGHDESGDKKQILTNEKGNIAIDGDYDVANNSNPSSSGLVLHDRTATGVLPTRENQNVRPTGKSYDDGVKTIVALDIALHDEEGKPFSEENPLPVTFSESEGEEVHDFKDSAAPIAKDASDSHTYIVPVGKVFLFEQVIMDASVQHKIEVAYGTAGAEVRKFVRFGTKSKDSSFELKRSVRLTAGQQIVITRTNQDQQSATLFSTIVGLLKSA